MRLDELTAGLARADASGQRSVAEVEIGGLAYDSRSVRPGDLFFCVTGFQSDGHEFAAQAVRAGAAALVVERPLGQPLPEVLVRSAREAMAPIASRFFGDPTATLRVVGVTGTNGKTTTAYLLRALLEAQGVRCGLLGTVTSVIGGAERPVVRTTPEAIDLQADFRAMLRGGDGACAMEVSSHALELQRTDAIHFAAAVFTNLSRDHLDFHASMEDYFQAKRRLFFGRSGADARAREGERPAVSVVNVADPHGARLAAELDGVRTFAVDAPADYSASELRCGFGGCSFKLTVGSQRRDVTLPMPGRFNVANALGALATAHAMGGELDALVAALEQRVRVPGRFEPVDEGQGFAVIVDYAHTPDSLQNVLEAARDLIGDAGASGRLVCVFGAGGDRDRGKRPLMGQIAASVADIAIVTSDNPRSEDPQRIVAEVLSGAQGGSAEVLEVVDRTAAIGHAVELARSGDVVVIAGKGHEQGQEFAHGAKVPFDDVTVARQALASAAPATR
ncbi:MAG TPA: UDP-N-acetylmuramoyl-L-alanyl-D-glutamate--2,6-diaminopimelate ligase [Solirubrobacteraceae bacterium]|jgi:UDP-N-acetylmuramoyl-L-alanyl-D-glutamate--2,6-diaminopimelate ligase|nr:UDP-N-acetylmuramoyl-L-alanyl-D-glutamate--2,6-diaminopimelate ligase [Solirubrobacteraceae bacterium]